MITNSRPHIVATRVPDCIPKGTKRLEDFLTFNRTGVQFSCLSLFDTDVAALVVFVKRVQNFRRRFFVVPARFCTTAVGIQTLLCWPGPARYCFRES